MALEKEVKKRNMTLDDLEPEEEAVDGDLDAGAPLLPRFSPFLISSQYLRIINFC